VSTVFGEKVCQIPSVAARL